MNPFYSNPELISYANDNDAFIPEVWANESLMILDDSLVAASMVHRDFSMDVANFGDVVNTRRPSKMRTTRKIDGEDITTQDATVTNVQVALDQRAAVSFLIHDGEWSKSFKDLAAIHLAPAIQAVARGVDRCVLGHVHKFYRDPTRRAGKLGGLSSSTAQDYILEAFKYMNIDNVPDENRNLLLAPTSEVNFLKTGLFVAAEQRGDGGRALESARLGQLYGFNTFRAKNIPVGTTSGVDTVAGTITNALAAGGSGAQACTINSYEVQPGEFAVVAGNQQPTFVTAATASTNTTSITLNEANKYATDASAVVTVYKNIDVNGAYAVGWHKEVVLDGWTNAPQVGQLIAFGTSTNRRTYTIIESYLSGSGEQSVLLDRPLEVALTNNQLAFPGPVGDFNWVMNRNALALVTRPLANPPQGSGVMSVVRSYNDMVLRLQLAYDPLKQATRFNVDLLYGIALLDEQLGLILLG